MHSTVTNKEDYNHVLNKLQDYMLTGKVLARTFYQQGTSIQNKTKNEETKLETKLETKFFQKKDKEVNNFFYPKEKDGLFWCFFIIQNGFEKYEYPDATSFVNEKTTKFKLIEHMRHNKQQLKSKKIKNTCNNNSRAQ